MDFVLIFEVQSSNIAKDTLLMDISYKKINGLFFGKGVS
jgi:hypothetical protein